MKSHVILKGGAHTDTDTLNLIRLCGGCGNRLDWYISAENKDGVSHDLFTDDGICDKPEYPRAYKALRFECERCANIYWVTLSPTEVTVKFGAKAVRKFKMKGYAIVYGSKLNNEN